MSKKKKVVNPTRSVNKSAWVLLGAVVVLAVFTLVSLNSSNLIGNAVHKVNSAQKGSQLLMEVKDVEGVHLIKYHFAEQVNDKIIKIDQVNQPKDFSGKIYSAFKIDTEVKIEKIYFTLRITEEKLNSLGLSKTDIKLYHNNKELPTKLTKIDSGYIYYQSISENFGEFVIGKITNVVKKEESIKVEQKEVVPIKKQEAVVEKKTIEEKQALVGKTIKQNTGVSFLDGIKKFFSNLFS